MGCCREEASGQTWLEMVECGVRTNQGLGALCASRYFIRPDTCQTPKSFASPSLEHKTQDDGLGLAATATEVFTASSPGVKDRAWLLWYRQVTVPATTGYKCIHLQQLHWLRSFEIGRAVSRVGCCWFERTCDVVAWRLVDRFQIRYRRPF